MLSLLIVCAALISALIARRRQAGRMSYASGLLTAWPVVAVLTKPLLLYYEMSIAPDGIAYLWNLLPAVLCCMLLLLLRSRAVRFLVGGALVLLLATILWIELLHYRFFGDLVSVGSLLAAHQVGDLVETAVALAQARDWLLFADCFLALPVMLLIGGSKTPRQRRSWLAAVAALFLLLVAVAAYDISKHPLILKGASRGQDQLTRRYGFYGLLVLDSLAWAGQRGQEPLAAAELEELTRWFRERARQRAGVGPCFAAARGRSVLILQVEALQSFVIGLSKNGSEITPHLNRLRESALLATSLQDQTYRGRSSAADFVYLTSILPVTEAVAYEYPTNQYQTFAHLLADRGYQTIAAVPTGRASGIGISPLLRTASVPPSSRTTSAPATISGGASTTATFSLRWCNI